MNVQYLKKAAGVLTATAVLPPAVFITSTLSYPAEISVPVEVWYLMLLLLCAKVIILYMCLCLTFFTGPQR